MPWHLHSCCGRQALVPKGQDKQIPAILVVGSINADLIAYYDESKRIGNYVFGDDFRFNLGGKGLNQAVNVAASGFPAILVGRVGDDSFGHEILRELMARDIKTNHILRDKITHTGIGHVRVNQSGEYDTVVINGANLFLDEEQIDLVATSDLQVSFVLMNYEILSEVVTHAAGKFRALGAETIINLSPIAEGIIYSIADADYLITNEEEARSVLKSVETDVKTLAQLLQKQGAKSVVITRGSEGVFGVDQNGNAFVFEREPVTVENTIGAGDTFLSIFAVALNSGAPFDRALEIANYSAAQVCTKKESFLSQSDIRLAAEKFAINIPQTPITMGSERLHD